jgi:transcriptional/translational regulatory protein YebC/TACO1
VCELTRVPKSTEKITDKTKAGKIFDFIGELEEHDDVNGVNANFEIPDEIIAGLGDS